MLDPKGEGGEGIEIGRDLKTRVVPEAPRETTPESPRSPPRRPSSIPCLGSDRGPTGPGCPGLRGLQTSHSWDGRVGEPETPFLLR